MTVTFRNYIHEKDYQCVSDFLIEDVLRDLSGLMVGVAETGRGAPLRPSGTSPKYDNLNFAGRLSEQIVVFKGELVKDGPMKI